MSSETNDTSLSIADSFEGQLREEITIQSNLIFTLERREERFTADPAESKSISLFLLQLEKNLNF